MTAPVVGRQPAFLVRIILIFALGVIHGARQAPLARHVRRAAQNREPNHTAHVRRAGESWKADQTESRRPTKRPVLGKPNARQPPPQSCRAGHPPRGAGGQATPMYRYGFPMRSSLRRLLFV